MEGWGVPASAELSLNLGGPITPVNQHDSPEMQFRLSRGKKALGYGSRLRISATKVILAALSRKRRCTPKETVILTDVRDGLNPFKIGKSLTGKPL